MDVSKILIYSQDSPLKVSVTSFESPVGTVVAAADDTYLYLVMFEDVNNWNKKFQSLALLLNCAYVEYSKNKILQKLNAEITAYFDGKLKKFTVPVKTFGSEFQKEVWNALLDIPYGITKTYGELATSIGKPGSARAVGAACGANSHFLIIPCHRLVASGSKGGYSGGVDRKDKLLSVEKQYS